MYEKSMPINGVVITWMMKMAKGNYVPEDMKNAATPGDWVKAVAEHESDMVGQLNIRFYKKQ